MKWSWKIGEFAGIGVFIHATFILLIGFLAVVYWNQGHSLAAVASGVGFILALFACVVLHEFGHALTARKFGIKTRDITLLPIGGLARLERIPDEPKQELLVALAGPAVNVVIAALLWGIIAVAGPGAAIEQALANGRPIVFEELSFLAKLMAVNIFLVLFNMIPAFPMDGGRVLRSLLAMKLNYVKATNIAAGLGQGIALLFGFLGLFSNPFLVFIAFFVWIGAAQEASMAQMKYSLGGIPVSYAMVTDFHALAPTDSLQRAIELMLSGMQHDFPVVDDGKVVGVLTRRNLMEALARQGQETPVSEVMSADIKTADASEMLESAFARLHDCNCQTLPVLRFGRLIGLLTMENMGEFVAVRTALGQHREHMPAVSAPKT